MQVAAEAFLARLGDCSVVLDVRRDKYFLLGSRLGDKVETLANRSDQDERKRAVLADLVACGVLSSETLDAPLNFEASEEICMPRRTAIPTRGNGLGLGGSILQTASVLRALFDIDHSLRTRPFRDTIERLRKARRLAFTRRQSLDDQRILDAFYAARPWFPIHPICRLDAPALALHFWRQGGDARLVFGVRVNPFAAHCWTQIGETALNEPSDKLLQYSPIMIV